MINKLVEQVRRKSVEKTAGAITSKLNFLYALSTAVQFMLQFLPVSLFYHMFTSIRLLVSVDSNNVCKQQNGHC